MTIRQTAYLIYVLAATVLLYADAPTRPLPPPVITMSGVSKPLVPPKASLTAHSLSATPSVKPTADPSGVAAVNMKLLVLAGDTTEFSYQAITGYLNQIGVPYQGIGVDTLIPDLSGNRLSGLALTDPATGRGLYQGIIETNSTFGVCNPVCGGLLSALDFATIDNYALQFKVRVVAYYAFPEAKWGLSFVSSASYTAASPLNVSLTPAGAAVFSYINSKNAIPVSGSGTGGIFAYQTTAVAAAGETTTPILTAGANAVGVTHTTADGRETMALTFDNFPTLLHSLAFSYGVINWVTKGVFLGSRQIHFSPQDDDLLYGNRLYAPTLPQCPIDPSCPYVRGTNLDLQALANWQTARHLDPLFPFLQTTFLYVGVGSTPGFAPFQDTLPAAMTALAGQFGWMSHTWDHGNIDCHSLSGTGTCIPQTLNQSLFELEQNLVYGKSLGLPLDTTSIVTPFNGGLSNPSFLQASTWEGITSIISADDPPSPGTGAISPLVPSLLFIPRRVTNLFDDVDSPLTGAFGSLPDKYNSLYGPNGTTPFFTANQTYSQIIDNESTMLMQMRWLTYEPYPVGFHTSNSIAYDNVHSMLTDLFDATIAKYEKLYTLPVTTLPMRDVAPLLLNRMSYNSSGVTGVYTPGVSVVLTTANAATIPVTGACSQALCPAYGGQIQDSVSMAANSSVTLSLTAGTGVALSAITLNPPSVGSASPAQGLVTLNGVADRNVVVTLNSNSAAAIVPATVTVTAGNSGAPFTVATGAVTTVTTAIVSANYNGVTRTFPLTITPAVALSGLSLNPSTVAGGASSSGTVSLTGPAPAAGFVIQLLSNNVAAVVPATVTVNSGSSTATFPVTTTAVTASITGNIVAVYNAVTVSSALTVTPSAPITLSSVSLNPASVTGGNSSTGTVTLSGAAPTGGIVVSLSSGNAAVVVPSNVTVGAGSTSASFAVTTKVVAASVSATVGATFTGLTVNAVLTVNPTIVLSVVSLNPASVTGGNSSTGTVTLSGAAPTGGIVVTLSSGNAAAVVPSSVTVNAGNTSATFAVTTKAVAASVTATVGATYNGLTVNAALTVNPAIVLSAVSLNPASVTGGNSSTGTVTLSGVAPTGGIVVTLSSGNAAAVVPSTVTVNAGSASATFAVATKAVAASVTATVGATYNGFTVSAALTVNPVIALSAVSLNPASVTGGDSSTGTVTLSGAAPTGGIVVSLSSGNAAAVVPSSVTVNAGSASATFAVATKAVAASVTATVGATYNGLTVNAILTVNPAIVLSAVSLNPASVTGGNSSTGTVTLSGVAPTGGIVVTLSSGNAAAVVPSTVTVNAGSASATFAVATKAVAASVTATVGATYNGFTVSAALTVNPVIALSAVSLNPASVTGGDSSTGTVTLTAPAPAGGIVVTLSSGNAAAIVPSTVTVNAGNASATFAVTTKAVTALATATISAAYSGVIRTATLTVNPPVTITGLSLSSTSVEGGDSTTGTVTLSGPAPAGGIRVLLDSEIWFIASVPESITIPAGASKGTFTVSTQEFFFEWDVTISARYGNTSKSVVLRVGER